MSSGANLGSHQTRILIPFADNEAVKGIGVVQGKTNLSRLLNQVESGEDVVIARNGKPVAKLIPIHKRGKRQFGSMRGLISIDDSFFDPLAKEELAAWEGDCGCDFCSTPTR